MSKKSEILNRQEKALHLREIGMSMTEIAEKLGYLYQGAPDACAAGRAISLAMVRRTKLQPASRRFGVELETVGVTRGALADAIGSVVGYHVPVLGYHGKVCSCCNRHYSTAELLTIWKVEYDSSLTYRSSSHLTGEIVSPILQGESGFEAVETVCKAVVAIGATTNRTTGLHVHVEAADLSGYDVSRVVDFWTDNQSRIDQLVSRSRRNNHYCGPTSRSVIAGIHENAEMDNSNLISYRNKYSNVNISPLFSYGTIEFRQHQGSVNHKKVVSWIKFVQATITAAQLAIKIDANLEVAEMIDVMADKCGLAPQAASLLKQAPARLSR